KETDALLAELDLPPCEDGLLILKRSLPREKAPKITVNGSLATLAALQRLGEHWVDFHGPSEPRRLLKESHQLELLDLFGRAGEGVQGRVAALLREARQLQDLDPASQPLADRLASAAVELNDLGGEFSALSQQLQFDPEQAEQLTIRMNTWLDLKRRHGGDVP